MSDLRPEIRMTEAELQAGVEKFTEDGPLTIKDALEKTARDLATVTGLYEKRTEQAVRYAEALTRIAQADDSPDARWAAGIARAALSATQEKAASE